MFPEQFFAKILNPTPVNLDSGFKLVVQGRRISFEFRVSAKKYSDIAENPFFVFGFRSKVRPNSNQPGSRRREQTYKEFGVTAGPLASRSGESHRLVWVAVPEEGQRSKSF